MHRGFCSSFWLIGKGFTKNGPASLIILILQVSARLTFQQKRQSCLQMIIHIHDPSKATPWQVKYNMFGGTGLETLLYEGHTHQVQCCVIKASITRLLDTAQHFLLHCSADKDTHTLIS